MAKFQVTGTVTFDFTYEVEARKESLARLVVKEMTSFGDLADAADREPDIEIDGCREVKGAKAG